MYKKITIICFLVFAIVISLMTVLNRDTISYLERRKLKEFPKVDLSDPDFYADLDDYLTDHLAFRDLFIKTENLANKYVLQMSDNDGVYSDGGYLFDILIKDEKSLNNLIQKTNDLKDTYLSDRDVYFVAIPRKNDYSARYFPLDLRFAEFVDDLRQGLDMRFIDISELLRLDAYYHTDIHWSQDKLMDIARYICEMMGDEFVEFDAHIKKTGPLYGSLYSRSFYDIGAEEITYIDYNMNGIKVYDLESDSYIPVYDLSAINHPDAYDLFLGGPSAYLKITNANVTNGQKLIVFRDSFASALLPLLIPSYETIEVIDLRYYSESLLSELDLIEGAKVLYIYGTEFINQSGALR